MTRPCRPGALAAEVATEVQLLRAIQAELAAHAAAREKHYLQADPGQLARTMPGFAEISAPVLVAIMGRRAGSATAPGSSPMRAWRRGPARPVRPTARASR